MNTDAQSLYNLLENKSPKSTQMLVDKSASNRLNEFLVLARYILANDSYTEFHNMIHKTISFIQEEPEDRFCFRLSSPLFRGWINRLGCSLVEFSSKSSINNLLELWPNMFYDPVNLKSNFNAEFKVLNSICSFFDSRFVLKVPDCKKVRLLKRDDEISVITEDGQLICKLAQKMLLDDEIQVKDNPTKKSDNQQPVSVIKSRKFPNSNISLTNFNPLLKLKLDESRVPERNNGILWENLDLYSEAYGNFYEKDFLDAYKLLEITWPEKIEDFHNTLQVVVPRSVPKGWKMNGFTISSYQGAIWIGAKGLVPVFEALVHEQSHVKHRYIEEVFPMLASVQKADKFQVGWRTDLRPIVGIYEGVYVNIHSFRALGRLLQHQLLDSKNTELAFFRYKDLISQTRKGVEILEKYACFTQIGEVFLEWALQSIKSENNF